MKTLFPLLSLFACCGVAQAAALLVDFGPVATTGTPETWNSFTSDTSGSALALLDTTGLGSGITLTLNNAFSPLNEDPAPSGPYPTTVTEDSFFAPGDRRMTLSGLNPSLTYNLTFYAYIARSDTRLTDIEVNGMVVTVEPGNGTTTGNFVTLPDLVPTPGGTLQIDYSRATGGGANLVINAMEISFVPEPSSLLLGTLGLVPLLRRRRA